MFWLACWAAVLPAAAADRARVEAFLEVTGFDVALDSIALSASTAPDMLGVDAGAFGSQWTEMSEDVFDTEKMRGLALDILENTLDDAALDHAAAFYASDLGKRLVRAENSSHLIEDDEVKQLAGNRIISDLVKAGSKRVAMYQRMGSAIDAAGTGVKALQQIQFRFLMAAAAAGVIDLELDADELRALMKEQEGELRLSLQASSLAASAYTYQEFSDAEVQAYVEALEEEPMQRVYELLNAVQYEITANRFEELAHRMAELTPGQDI
ncbi:DUF2059 domain-containing protein [Leisingera sp. S132]|uniref:DUF2059 domain-containing protein n=1 Tax=Leisingera sp. S132 TaxID=2867016 RepID=UPI0021A68A96|nr:DUF2059 domain-containing protein [Leisingera sp. S132]UWQ81030.1 DUF2059 domain-containing protein [Leisingera sp. S132]